MSAVVGSALSARHTSKPDTSGISISSSTSSGRGSPPASWMAVPASPAVSTSYSSPSARAMSASSSSASSTARTTGLDLVSVGKGDYCQPERVDRFHHHDELLEVHRLGDVAVGVQVVGAQHVFLRLRRRQNDDRDALQLVV